MGTLLQGGLSMMDALRISRGVMRNVVIENEIKAAEKKIIEGHSLSQELGRSDYFPQIGGHACGVLGGGWEQSVAML